MEPTISCFSSGRSEFSKHASQKAATRFMKGLNLLNYTCWQQKHFVFLLKFLIFLSYVDKNSLCCVQSLFPSSEPPNKNCVAKQGVQVQALYSSSQWTGVLWLNCTLVGKTQTPEPDSQICVPRMNLLTPIHRLVHLWVQLRFLSSKHKQRWRLRDHWTQNVWGILKDNALCQLMEKNEGAGVLQQGCDGLERRGWWSHEEGLAWLWRTSPTSCAIEARECDLSTPLHSMDHCFQHHTHTHTHTHTQTRKKTALQCSCF